MKKGPLKGAGAYVRLAVPREPCWTLHEFAEHMGMKFPQILVETSHTPLPEPFAARGFSGKTKGPTYTLSSLKRWYVQVKHRKEAA